MGKRSDFERLPRDFYKTPYAAVAPLRPFLPHKFTFYEPCAGDSALTAHLEHMGGTCVGQSDIEPMAPLVMKKDALALTLQDVPEEALIITNPPWSRDKASGYIFHRMIEHFCSLGNDVWLLADADWVHTKQASPYIKEYLVRMVSIGRVKWIEGTNMTGKDNCCWYQFSNAARFIAPVPLFYGRDLT